MVWGGPASCTSLGSFLISGWMWSVWSVARSRRHRGLSGMGWSRAAPVLEALGLLAGGDGRRSEDGGASGRTAEIGGETGPRSPSDTDHSGLLWGLLLLGLLAGGSSEG